LFFENKTKYLGPVSERRLSENSEYVNSEMRRTLGFPFQNGRYCMSNLRKQGKSSPFQKERYSLCEPNLGVGFR